MADERDDKGGVTAALPTDALKNARQQLLGLLVQRAAEAAGGPGAGVVVHHLAAADRAQRLAVQLQEAITGIRELYVSELGAVIGAHVGPGAVGVVVAPWPADSPVEESGGSAEG